MACRLVGSLANSEGMTKEHRRQSSHLQILTTSLANYEEDSVDGDSFASQSKFVTCAAQVHWGSSASSQHCATI